MENNRVIPLAGSERPPNAPPHNSPAHAPPQPIPGHPPARPTASPAETILDDFDEEFEVGNDARPLIPPGDYQATCFARKFLDMTKFGRARKLFLWFSIYDGPHQDTPVYLCIPLPPTPEVTKGAEDTSSTNGKKRRAGIGKVGVGSKLYATYMIASGGKPPQRKERLSLKVFKKKMFLVRVKTVKPKFQDGKSEKPALFHYSIVSEIIEKLT